MRGCGGDVVMFDEEAGDRSEAIVWQKHNAVPSQDRRQIKKPPQAAFPSARRLEQANMA